LLSGPTEADLAAAGMLAQLRGIDAVAILAVGQWRGRRVAWPWHLLADDWRRSHRASDAIPTLAEAKRRLAEAGPDRWMTPAAMEALAQAEDASGGWLLGPAVYRPGETR